MILYKVAEQAQQNNNGGNSFINSVGALGTAGLAGYGAYHGVNNELKIKKMQNLENNKDKANKVLDTLGIKNPKTRADFFENHKKELENLKKTRGKNALFLLGGTAGMLGFNHLESKKDNKKYKNADSLYSDMADNTIGTTVGALAGFGSGILGVHHGLVGDKKKALGYLAASVPLATAGHLLSNRFTEKGKNNKDLMESDAYKDAQKQDQPVMPTK